MKLPKEVLQGEGVDKGGRTGMVVKEKGKRERRKGVQKGEKGCRKVEMGAERWKGVQKGGKGCRKVKGVQKG